MDGAEFTGDGTAAAMAERRMLVRLCAYLSGSHEAAEDLAQETLIEAWRHQHSLRDPAKRAAWLKGIARNVCRRWLRTQSQDTARLADTGGDGGRDNALDSLIGDMDLEIDLERAELATLLDRALALLPPATRDVLVERFINELSHAEIAERLRVPEGTVKVRVHRGKLGLRRALTTRFAADLDAYGFSVESDGWQRTRVWCPSCGRSALSVRWDLDDESIAFRCPACEPDPEIIAVRYSLANPQFAAVLAGVKRPASILRRGSEWLYSYFTGTGIGGKLPCSRCGQSTILAPYLRPEGLWSDGNRGGLHVQCEACGEELCASRSGLVLAAPQVQQFRREHGRVRTLAVQQIEVDGRPAVVSRLRSVTTSAALDVVTDEHTYRILGIHAGSTPAAGL